MLSQYNYVFLICLLVFSSSVSVGKEKEVVELKVRDIELKSSSYLYQSKKISFDLSRSSIVVVDPWKVTLPSRDASGVLETYKRNVYENMKNHLIPGLKYLKNKVPILVASYAKT